MPRDVCAYLEDIRDSSALIVRIVEENDVHACLTDRVLRSAIEREFLIIGEAVNKLLDLVPELVTRLTSSRLIVDFRNRLAHEYHNIDDATRAGKELSRNPEGSANPRSIGPARNAG